MVLPMDGRTRILFIDDEELICTMAEDFLELQGYDIETYEDSLEALAAFSIDPSGYDIVVSDQTMPGISGFDLLSRIGEIRRDIPRILCTGYSDYLGALDREQTGIDAFFIKPYRFDELIGQIQKLV